MAVLRPRHGQPEVYAFQLNGVVAKPSVLFRYMPPRTQLYEALGIALHLNKIAFATFDELLIFESSEHPEPFQLRTSLPLPLDIVNGMKGLNHPHVFQFVSEGNLILAAKRWVACWDLAENLELVHATEVPGLDLSFPGGWGGIGRQLFFRVRPRSPKLPGDELMLVDVIQPTMQTRVPMPFRTREVFFDAATKSEGPWSSAADDIATKSDVPWLLVAVDSDNVIHCMRYAVDATTGSVVTSVLSSWTPPPEKSLLQPHIDVFNGRLAMVAGFGDAGAVGGVTLFVWDKIDRDVTPRSKDVDSSVSSMQICGDFIILGSAATGPNTSWVLDASSLCLLCTFFSAAHVLEARWGFLTVGAGCRSLSVWRPPTTTAASREKR